MSEPAEVPADEFTQCAEMREHPKDPDSTVVCTLEAGHARPWVESAPGYFDHYTEGVGFWRSVKPGSGPFGLFLNSMFDRIEREDHIAMAYLGGDGHLYATCSCGQWKRKMRNAGITQPLHALDAKHQEHLAKLPTLRDLPDGTYFDGTYEWEKEEGSWTPLRAPSGMPTAPKIENLRKVVIERTYEDIS